MALNLTMPRHETQDFNPRIAVIGVGGGGCNAVNNMIASGLDGVDFLVANTDAQSLLASRADRKIQLGPHLTQGLGAGAKPEIGRAAAEEAMEEVAQQLAGLHMVFITAGMGGGTGTGAAPVVARLATERGILTVGVVTKPFDFEGPKRRKAADQGIEELQRVVDTLIVIPNQNLFRLATERTTFAEAFKMADNVLYMGVRGVTDLMVRPGLVNLDFADIRTVMAEMGKAMMGTGEADGDERATRAAEAAISNPLLEEASMKGARGVLINITGGADMTLFEVDEAANKIREQVDEEANIIFGSSIDEDMNGRIRVSVVATGIDAAANREVQPGEGPRLVAVGGLPPSQALAQRAEESRGASQAEGARDGASLFGMVTQPRPEPRPMTMPGLRRPQSMEAPRMQGPTSHGNAAQAMQPASVAEVVAAVSQRPDPLHDELDHETAPAEATPQHHRAAPVATAQPAPAPQGGGLIQRILFGKNSAEPSRSARAEAAPGRTEPARRAEPSLHGSTGAARPELSRGELARGELARGELARGEPTRIEPSRGEFARPELQRPELRSEPQRPELQRSEATRGEPARPLLRGGQASEEQMLDIPAFLRRQAN